jgi:SynChlorMet cassette protein ScmC
MWFSLLCVYNKAIEQGGLPFHSALVQSGGKGVLLAGKGNIGKSTCARRIALPWQAVCDDETLVVRDTAGSYKAHPFPTWSDYLYKRREPTWDVQQSFPLSAIFFLQQAESDEAIPLGGAKAAVCINESATQVCRRNWRGLTYKEEAAFKKKVFENACLLAKAVPVFILHFSLKGKFWKEIEKVL